MLHPHNPRPSRGSVLLAAAILTAIFAIFMGGVLLYVTNEYRFNIRNHQYAQSLYLAEAAVEDAMSELQYANAFSWTNGWVQRTDSFGSYYTRTTNIYDTEGNYVGVCSNQVYNYLTPVWVVGIGTATNTIGGLANSQRAIKVVMAASSLYQMALISKAPLSFAGNIVIDSYDSTIPAKNSGTGTYSAAHAQNNGNVATTAGGNAVSFPGGSAHIDGTIDTAPGGTLTPFSGGGAFGPTNSANQISAGSSLAPAVSNGWLKADFTTPPPDATLPAALASASNLGTITLTSAGTQTINSGNWQVNALTIANAATLTINGTVSLYILGNVTVANGGLIKVPVGSSLTVYVGGPMLDLSGAGVINSIVQPVYDQWFGLSTLSTAIFENGTSFIGTFYAPDTFVSMVGNTQIYGAVVCASNTIGNSAGIHFDESLKTSNGGAGNYSIAAWQELRKISGVYQ